MSGYGLPLGSHRPFVEKHSFVAKAHLKKLSEGENKVLIIARSRPLPRRCIQPTRRSSKLMKADQGLSIKKAPMIQPTGDLKLPFLAAMGMRQD